MWLSLDSGHKFSLMLEFLCFISLSLRWSCLYVN